jgi:ketosteroid isomerase-like protein
MVNTRRPADNVALAVDAVTALGASDHSQVLGLVDDDIVFEAAFYPTVPMVHGREAFAAFIDGVHRTFSRVAFEVIDAFASADLERIVVECRGDGVVASTGAPYRNHYVMIIRFRGGRITEWRELSNPLVYLSAVAAT